MVTKDTEQRNRSEPGPTEDEIRLRAYEIYLAREGREGDALRDWLEAEAELTPPQVVARLQAAA
jgi:hypothetical protein